MISACPIFLSIETVTFEPLILQIFLPSSEIFLEISKDLSSSQAIPNSSKMKITSSFISSKYADTSALLLPVLISSRDVLSPRIALIASMMIDLPAPVSPVNTLRPLLKSITASLIIAISDIFRFESINISLSTFG